MAAKKGYKPTKFMAKGSYYDKEKADFVVDFLQSLKHTKGIWYGKPFELLEWQEQIIRDIFGTIKKNGFRQFNTAYIEVPKKTENPRSPRGSRCCCFAVTESRAQRFTAAPPTANRRASFSMSLRKW